MQGIDRDEVMSRVVAECPKVGSFSQANVGLMTSIIDSSLEDGDFLTQLRNVLGPLSRRGSGAG